MSAKIKDEEWSSNAEFFKSIWYLVCCTAVFSVVTQRSSPQTAAYAFGPGFRQYMWIARVNSNYVGCPLKINLIKTLFTWSGGPRSSGVSFFCFVSSRAWKQKKPTPLNRGPPLHVNRPFKSMRVKGGMSLRNGMWHGLRNDIIMRNGIYYYGNGAPCFWQAMTQIWRSNRFAGPFITGGSNQ